MNVLWQVGHGWRRLARGHCWCYKARTPRYLSAQPPGVDTTQAPLLTQPYIRPWSRSCTTWTRGGATAAALAGARVRRMRTGRRTWTTTPLLVWWRESTSFRRSSSPDLTLKTRLWYVNFNNNSRVDWVKVLRPTRQNRSFRRRSSQPMYWLSTED